MKLKIGIGQINVKAGSPIENLKKITQYITDAKKQKCDVVVFPEMAIPGYMLADLWEDEAFVKNCTVLDEEIKKASEGITVIWGNVYAETRSSIFNEERTAFGNDGRLRKYNAARISQNKNYLKPINPLPTLNSHKVVPENGMVIKTNEPLYREFEDQRHFIPLKELAQQTGANLKDLLQPFVFQKNGKTYNLGVLICEDIWTGDYVYNGEILNPAQILAQNKADILIVISTSPYGWRKEHARERVIYNVQKKLFDEGTPLPIVYVNAEGCQNNSKNEYGLDGRSAVYDKNNKKIFQAPAWKEDLYCVEINVKETNKGIFNEFQPITQSKKQEREELLAAIIEILREFAKQSGIENYLVGLSGGIDSALVAYLCTQAVGKEHVFSVNVPTRFNSDWTKSTAKLIADNLGIAYQVVPIEDLTNNIRGKIKAVNFDGNYGSYSDTVTDKNVDENIQARTRIADIVSGIAAKYPKTVYTNNGNKSEVLIGYFTLDGDGRGAICPIGDLYKTDIANLCAHINEKHKKPLIPWELIAPIFEPTRYYDNWDSKQTPIPADTKILVPSAELSEDQNVDEGKGDPIIYLYHDLILKRFVEYRQNPEDILNTMDKDGIPGLAKLFDVNSLWLEKTIKKHFSDMKAWIIDLERFWNMFHVSIFKQIQSPPVISVSKRSLGFDFRRSVTPPYYTYHYKELKSKLLNKVL